MTIYITERDIKRNETKREIERQLKELSIDEDLKRMLIIFKEYILSNTSRIDKIGERVSDIEERNRIFDAEKHLH